jgi:YD repeat-containing protein
MRLRHFFTALLSLLTILTLPEHAAPQNHHTANSSPGAADQYIETASALSSRARANVYFKNPQSIFSGVQFSFVNVGKGNITFLRRDLVTSGRIPIILARVYDSASPGSTDFGPGWLVSAAESILLENGNAKLSTETGSVIDFIQSSNAGDFQLKEDYPSDYLTLTQTDSTTIKARLRTGQLKEFKQIGTLFRLTTVTDRNGNSVRLIYARGLLSRIENANHFIQLTRDSKDRIILAQDDSQRTVKYSYDNSGQLIKVDDISGKGWTYTYTANGQLKNATDPLQHLNFEISYDDSGRVRRLQLPSGSIKYKYDIEHALTTVTDRKQLISRFFQNEDGITMRIVNALGEETSVTLDSARNVKSLSRNGSVTQQMDYDHQHRLLSRQTANTSGAVNKTYSYDPATGLLNGVTSSDGQNQTFSYDPLGNLIGATLADGEHKYRYSSSGDLIGLATGSINVTFSPNSDGLTASMTENGHDITSLQYKPGGELSAATFPKVPSITYEYQASGLRSKILSGNNRRAEYTYDAAGNLTGSKIFDMHGKQINGQDLEMNDSYQLITWTLFDGKITNFQYDPNGNLTEIRKGNSRTRFEYDSLNRLTTVIAPDGQHFVYNYKPGERSVVDRHQHSSILVEDLRDTGLTFSSALQVMAARAGTGVFGSVRFSEELGTFELSNAVGSEIARPQANIEAALEKQFLVNTNMTPKARRSGFNIPFNTMFMPAEYASINCCPECYITRDDVYCPPCFIPPPPPQPSLTSITPSSTAANAGSVAVTLSGSFNDTSESVNISGSGISVSPNPAPLNVNGDAATTFTLASSIVAGSYNVSVSDSGGPSNSVAFNVTPVITSISPAQGLVGTGQTVTINGAGFASGATIQAGPSITISNISVASSTSMSATFTIQNSSDAGGSWNVSTTVNGQTSNNDKTFFVQIPSSLQVLSVSTVANGASGGCAFGDSGPFGIRVDIKYQVLDQHPTPQAITNATMVPHEVVPPNVDQDVCPSLVSTCTHTTASDGTWHDAPVGACNFSAFSVSFTQNLTMIVGQNPNTLTEGVRYAVRTNNFSANSSSSGHGSISNGSDISKSQ